MRHFLNKFHTTLFLSFFFKKNLYGQQEKKKKNLKGKHSFFSTISTLLLLREKVNSSEIQVLSFVFIFVPNFLILHIGL